ncbi:glutamine synthetase family protein [Acidocella aminolytica]|jgi:glutamine synthetase|uniref:Glutamine synthetase n=1 Tax=Acidocella aminolytica 101 = DSM 11237 TaxID=1120923 RepID=A0A0D6PKM3_9PROT|nr:glutamine synthetase family protein [Acidocella aminolytica]GAN81294.1 glutamine synthetase [Acidocella aminolytica 101 = DSM 11237]GBQ34204.1 glutamine synthetase [Acidocella aminolytica 101 = DSM 11237]SHE83331.1 glutamine synthetase [Acidocella aminolytica 101 = DSM 11237]
MSLYFSHTSESAATFADSLRRKGIEYVRFELPDLAGLSRGKTVPIDHVASYTRNGLNLYGGTVTLDTSSNPIPGTGYNEDINFADCLMVPDPETVSDVPWMAKTARVICDTKWYDGSPQMAAPRTVLKAMLAKAAERGFGVKMGHEFEFYVVDLETRQPLYAGAPIFVTAVTHRHPVLDKLMRVLKDSGVDMITANGEFGPGQWELNFAALDGIAAADRAFVFKNTVKEYLRTEGLLATFMTKPYAHLSGSCSHFHLSLYDLETGKNLFLDEADPDGMSALMKSFIQGILDHAPAAQAIWNPTPNCYRRIRPGTFAPSNVSWGVEDRSASVRIKASKDKRQHLEVRVPSALSNPYLTAASTLAAGLLGVEQQAVLTPQRNGLKEADSSFKKLPTEIHEALAALRADNELTEMLGEAFMKVYTIVKTAEINRLRDEIPAAETAEYFDLY